MAWSSTTVIGSALSTNYIHDFDSGIFTLPFNIVPGLESFIVGGGIGVSNTIHTYDTWVPSGVGTSASGLVSHPDSGFAIGVISAGNICINSNIQGGVGNIPFAGDTFTRTNILLAGGYGTFGGTLQGPYVVAYSAPGIKSVDIFLYGRFPSTWINAGPVPPIGLPQQPTYHGAKNFSFEIVQQAVSVTRRNSSSGAILSDGSSINDMDTLTNSSIVLNKASNRGDSVLSQWFVLKQDVITGVYNTAILSSDYDLAPGDISTSDQITLTWVNPGNYRVINRSTGSVAAGTNTDDSLINFNVGQSVVDTVTLPIVSALITPVTAFDNTVTSTDPLTGITTLEFTVEAVVDTTAASWNQQINLGVINTLILTPTAWTTELTTRCNIKCKVKKDGSTVDTRTGFGPHSFSLAEGTYDVGFEVTPKSGLVVVIPLGSVAIR